MLFVIYNLDRANASELRSGLRSRHQAYIESMGRGVWAEGPLLGAEGDEIGSMLVIDAASRHEATVMAARDPCNEAGLYDSTSIRPWHGRAVSPARPPGRGLRRVISDKVQEPPPELWSNCFVAGHSVYISGMTARGADWENIEGLDAYEQSCIIFEKIRSLMEAAGGSMDDIVKLLIFVTHIADREEVWRSRKMFFDGDFPACSLIEVSALALPEMRVEIEAVAHLSRC